MRKLTILTMVLALAAVAVPAMAEAGCAGATDALFLVEAPVLATPAEATPTEVALPEGQEPLMLSGTCEDDCQQGYQQCLIICSKSACLISCEDQRCYCLRGCGSGCNLHES